MGCVSDRPKALSPLDRWGSGFPAPDRHTKSGDVTRMNRQVLNATITAAALGFSMFAYLAFVSLEAGAAEYEVRVLDPLPEGFIRFHDAQTFEPRILSLFGPNESGELGGNAVDGTVSRTFALRWNSDGEVSILDVPEDAVASAAYDINKRGDIVGWYSIPPIGGGASGPVAAIWHRDGTRTDLPSLAEDGRAQAYSINDRGYAVGFGGGPVVWNSRGDIIELPLPDGISSAVAWSITDNGVIFGRAHLTPGLDPEEGTLVWCRTGRC